MSRGMDGCILTDGRAISRLKAGSSTIMNTGLDEKAKKKQESKMNGFIGVVDEEDVPISSKNEV